ncbi:MAG: hypothetical protein JO317_01035, partial [Verrucomicrobiae bacterium]|nr:hypothetical protein [Verrucomicrobiae bacterium]
MKKLVIYSLAALVLAALALSSILASYQRRLLRQEATLQKRLRDLSDQNDKLEAELHRLALLAGRDVLQRRIEKEVQEIRGLKFLRPLQYKRLSREELPAYLKRDMLASYTPEEFQDYLESLAAMGFLPEGGDLEKTLIDLLGEQIAAFYDPREAALYTFETFDIDRTTDQTIYAHELTHALQDQHFGLLRNTPLE